MECFIDNSCLDALTRDINDSCDNLMHSGIESVGLIINKEDIDTIARDANNRRHITAITLKAGKRAYRLVNKRNNPFTGTNKTIEAGDFRNTWTKTVGAFIPTDGWEAGKDILDPLMNNKFVVILTHEWEHTNSEGFIDNKYEVFGLENGLRVSSLTQTAYENNDVYSVELQETGAALSGVYVQHGSWEAGSLESLNFRLNGDNSGYINPYTGEEVSAADFVAETVSGVTQYYIQFLFDGVTRRWYTSSDPALLDKELTMMNSQDYTDDTCAYLQGLLVAQDEGE